MDMKILQLLSLPYIQMPIPTTNANIISPAIRGKMSFIKKIIIATIIMRMMIPIIIVPAVDAIPNEIYYPW